MFLKRFLVKKIKRRNFIRDLIIFTPVFLGFCKLSKFADAARILTPRQGEGPFYPIDKPTDQDADLTFIKDRNETASGDIYFIQGRVLKPGGLPVQNATIEIWQANKWGRYQDRRDYSELPWDKNFQGYGRTQTDIEGRYAFKTIKPGGYNQGNMRRPPHIHFKVNLEGHDEFITQMYFDGEPDNNTDIILSRTMNKAQLIIKFRILPNGKKVGRFDLVLP